MANDQTTLSFSDGEVVFWTEQETIHIKAVSPHGDPVELTSEEARNIAFALLEVVKEIEP